jgi:hypothetical protein
MALLFFCQWWCGLAACSEVDLCVYRYAVDGYLVEREGSFAMQDPLILRAHRFGRCLEA